MSVIAEPYRELGYAKFAPTFRLGKKKGERLVRALEHTGFYQVENVSSGIWVRSRPRIRGTDPPPRFLEEVACLRAGWGSAGDSLGFLADYADTKYARTLAKFAGTELHALRKVLEDAYGSQREFDAWTKIGLALTIAHPQSQLPQLLPGVLQWFFDRHPNGLALILRSNDSYESLLSAMRLLYTYSIYPMNAPTEGGLMDLDTLREWQPVDSAKLASRILTVPSLLFYPWIASVEVGPLGLSFVFVFDKPPEHEPRFPFSWLHYLSSESEFAKQAIPLDAVLSDPESTGRRLAEHRRHIWGTPPSADQVLELFRCYVQAANAAFFELLDVTNFERRPKGVPEDEKGIDGVFAYEHLLTVDRVLRRTIATATTLDTSLSKTTLFEVADLWGTLSQAFGEIKAAERFKQLFRPTSAAEELERALSRLSSEYWRNELRRELNEAYSELRSKVIGSVFIPGVVGERVTLRQLGKEETRELSHDDFVAEVIRALRNTHHGYLTETSHGLKPGEVLSPSSGDTPDSMPYLAFLWWLAYVADPTGFVGMPTRGFGHDTVSAT